jgi:hypothetical protein
MLRGQQQLATQFFFPAPTGGLNRTDSVGGLPITEAYTLVNLVSATQGVSVRPGYTNHTTAIGNSASTEVRTLAAFNDVTRDKLLARDRMFAFTNQGIYDVTAAGSNPVLQDIYLGVGGAVIDSTGWKVKGGDAGWVSYVNFTNAAAAGGKHYFIACDLINGYHLYDPDGGGAGIGRWYKVTQGNSGQTIEGIDPTLLVQVCSWKGRLIFTEVDASRAWYLTPGAILGTGASKPVAIDMGTRFNYGGFLKGCYTWTYDGGAGIDDFLVVVSSGGDVVVWQGIAPGDASFQIKGVWYIGDVPRGRRIASEYGGDMLVMGSLGLLPISALVEGGREDETKYITYKIQSLLRRYFALQGFEWGWNISSVPVYGGVIVTLPRQNGIDTQLFVSSTLQAWSVLEAIPAIDWCQFRNKEYIGTYDGRVVLVGGSIDTRQVAIGNYTEDSVYWSMLTSFQPMENPAIWKAVQLIRPVWLAERLPTYAIAARYDFDIAVPQAVDPPPQTAQSLWDVALWDLSYWGGQFVTEQPVIGANNLGRWVAVALSGRSNVPTNLIGFNMIYTVGGLL